MPKVIVFAERMLPSTQTFIPLQVNELRRYAPVYSGLIPPDRELKLASSPILLTPDRSRLSRTRRELYRWTGVAPRFHAQLRRTGADLVHVHFAEAASCAVLLRKRLKLPFILHLRGGAELLSVEDLKKHAFQWPYLAFRKRLWRTSSQFLCVSEYIRQKALAAGFPEAKLRVHYTGMNLDAFTPTKGLSEKDPNLVLYVGRLVPYKGCNYLLQAMQILQQRLPKARLVIIGDGTFRPALEAMDRQLGTQAEFLGEQTQTTIRSWLERARVFCGPSVTLEDGMSEAFGNVFSEAQAMGVPVVSFRHGGIPETMQEGVTGLLAPERDVETLANQLHRYLADEEFWRMSREKGMQWVRENFDVRTQTAKLEKLYDVVVRQYQPGPEQPPVKPE